MLNATKAPSTCSNYSCNICGKSFSKPSFLSRHAVVHTKLKPFECDRCHKKFSQNSSLQRHVSTKHTQEIFEVSKEDPDKLAQQVLHSLKQLQHGLQCYTQQITKPAIPEKIKDVMNTTFYQACQVVDRLQPNGPAKIINTLSVSRRGRFFYACEFCSKEFQKSYDLIRHRRTHTQEAPYRCKYCMTNCKTANQLKMHNRVHILDAETGHIRHKHTCSLCQAHHRSRRLLTAHFKAEHPDAAILIKVNKERVVDPELETLAPLLPEPIRQWTTLTSLSSQRQYKCVYCATIFNRKDGCQRHMLTHLQNLLDARLDTKAPATVTAEYLVVRKRNSEFELLPVYQKTCPHCSKVFSKVSDVQRHIQSIHTKFKVYTCDKCKRRFTLKSSIDRHMRIHAPNLQKFPCRVCGRMYGSNTALQVHIRIHTGARPFKCQVCEQTFRTSGHKLAHMRAGRHKQKFNLI